MSKQSLVGFLVIASGSLASMQASATPVNLRLNPLYALGQVLNTGVEVGVTETVGVGVSGVYTANLGVLPDVSEGQVFEGSVTATYYASGMSSDSFYGKVDVTRGGLNYQKVDGNRAESAYNAGGVLGGYQWLWNNGLNLGLGAGLKLVDYTRNVNVDIASETANGVSTNFELKFGFMI